MGVQFGALASFSVITSFESGAQTFNSLDYRTA